MISPALYCLISMICMTYMISDGSSFSNMGVSSRKVIILSRLMIGSMAFLRGRVAAWLSCNTALGNTITSFAKEGFDLYQEGRKMPA